MPRTGEPFDRAGAAVVAGLSSPVFAATPDGVLLSGNAAFAELFEKTPETLPGRLLPDLLDELSWSTIRGVLEQAAGLAEGESVRVHVPEGVNRVDPTHPFLSPFAEITAHNTGSVEDGGLPAIVVVTQSAVLPVGGKGPLARRFPYFALAEHLRDIVFMTDALGIITYVSPHVAELTGTAVEDLIGHAIVPFFHTDDHDEINDVLVKARAGQSGAKQGLRAFDSEGGLRRFAISFSPILNDTGAFTGIIGVARDTTRLYRLERRLIRTHNLEMMRSLAEGIAGDFNNILVGISGNLSLLQAMIPKGDRAAGPLVRIEQAAERAVRLTEQLSACVRADRGRLQLVRVGDLIRRAAAEQPWVDEDGLSLRFDIDPDLPSIEADPAYLRQMFENLLQNAWESMPGGGEIAVRARRRVVLESEEPDLPPGDYVDVEVRDTGIGIEESMVERVFEPFFTTKTMRRGLGLTAVHSIAVNLGGRVEVESMPGEGTVFRVLLPVAFDAPSQPVTGATHLNRSILVIDDEAVVREFCSVALGGMGARVVTTDTGEDGLRRFAEQPDSFDVVLLDLVLPEISGAQVFARLREIRPDIRVILSSGYVDQLRAARESAEFAGAAAVLSKPYDLHELLALLGAQSPEG